MAMYIETVGQHKTSVASLNINPGYVNFLSR